MTLFRSLFVVVLLAGAWTQAPAQLYKWIDEDGNVVYSQFAPPVDTPGEVVPPPPPPAEDPATAQQRLQEQLQRSADYREDQELAAEKAAEMQTTAERDRERCAQARRNLQNLDGRSRQLYRTPDGSVVRLTEEERQQRRAEAQRVIDEACD
jgi:hypothetical protein